jgi:uncharacterized membrane protein YoaK (UPF0700 family)
MLWTLGQNALSRRWWGYILTAAFIFMVGAVVGVVVMLKIEGR